MGKCPCEFRLLLLFHTTPSGRLVELMLLLIILELTQIHEATRFHGSDLCLGLGCSWPRASSPCRLALASSPGCRVFAHPADYKPVEDVERRSVELFVPLTGVAHFIALFFVVVANIITNATTNNIVVRTV